MIRTVLFIILFGWLMQDANAQSCTATTYTFDLSASIDTSVSVSSNRNGDCCSGTNCIRFVLTINPNCSYVNFSVANPAPNGSAFYQVNCGPQTSLATPACVVGMTNVVITYCKPGNDAPIYTITAAGATQGSPDTTIKQGCTGKMGVKGLLTPTINWTSIYPGTPGTYNSYLSCTTGCDTVNVTPTQNAPPYIDYQVGGNRLCGPAVYDTIRIYTVPQFAVSISPINPTICPNGGSASLSASASGNSLYSYVWNTGDTTSSITVNAAGVYTVAVSDNSGCLPVIDSVIVTPLAVPAAPTISSNAPLCEGSVLNLSASYVANATYNWSGPNGFTSNLQNPSINNVGANNSGMYSVTVTVNGCTSVTSTANIIVNAIPAPPSVSNNGPVCAGNILNLSASNTSNANYIWTGPNGFNSTIQNPSITNVNVNNGGLYSVTATVNGCTSPAATTNVIINPLPNVPSVSSNSPVCSGATISLAATSVAGSTYSWTGPNSFNSASQNPTITNSNVNASGLYFVTASLNGCASAANSVNVVVNPIPSSPIANSNGPICEGSTLDLAASTIANANYNWTGPNGFSSSLQFPSIANTVAADAGNYSVTATVNGCTSVASNTNVVINPIPSAPSVSSNAPLCVGSTLMLSAGNILSANYSWLGPNNFSSSMQNPSIVNAATINSGNYSVTATVNGCTSNASNVIVVVNPIPSAPVLSNSSPGCAGSNVQLNASNIAGANYSWSGPNGFVSNQQNPLLTNINSANSGVYNAVVIVNGCQSPAASTTVVVNPIPSSPIANNNSAICEGSTLNLSASNILNATYNWTGPNGFVSSSQNNTIPNAAIASAGQYNVTATVNGCTSSPATTIAIVDQHTITNAGNNQTVCIASSSINLSGSVTGGSSSGIWSTNGTGGFSPTNTSLNSIYNLTNADKAAGSVVLTLTSTNNGSCPAVASSKTITFAAAPIANPGNDTSICSNLSLVLNGSVINASGGIWSVNGNGNFSPSNANLNATFSPSQSDVQKGNLLLTLTTTGNAFCAPDSKAITLILKPSPVVNAGADQIIVENYSATFDPTVSTQGLIVLWSPANYLSDPTVLNPVCTPKTDITYTITVRNNNGCSATDDVSVKVLKMPVIPNVFTPNNDGINDTWEIKWLSAFTDCSVEIYNRYGQLIWQSTGYGKSWDGTMNGKPVPAATYYYVINLKHDLKPLSGFVDIVR